MKVAAAFLAYNCAEYITDLLDSLVGQVDVIVCSVDEKDTQGTKAKIEEWATAPASVLDPIQPAAGDDGQKPAPKYLPKPEIIFGAHNLKTPPEEFFTIISSDAPEREKALELLEGTGFSIPRNYLFSLVPKDVDWTMWIDADDVFGTDVPLREYLTSHVPPQATAVWLPYLYHRNEEYGDVDTVFYRERILKMEAGPVWKGRCHEWCELRKTEVFVEGSIADPSKALLWIDHKNVGKTDSSGRNIGLLKAMIWEDPNDIRAILYLAHSLLGRNEHRDAAMKYEEYVAKGAGGAAPDEQYQALIWAARAWRAGGSISDSLRVADRAMMLMPQYQDAYIELSWSFAIQKDWRRCIELHETGLRKQRLHSILIHNPLDYDFNPFSIAHTAYFKLNMFEKALQCITRCLEYRPNDAEIRWRGLYYMSSWNRAKALEATGFVAKYLMDINEPIKALEAIKVGPAGALEDSEQLRKLQAEAWSRTSHLRDVEEYDNKWRNEVETVACTKEEVENGHLRYPRMQWIVDMCKRYGYKRILEVGVGNAVCSMMLVGSGVEVIGVDTEPSRVKGFNDASVMMGYRKLREAPEHTTIPPKHEHSGACHHNPDCYAKDPETTFIIQPATLVCSEHDSLCKSIEHEHEEWTPDCEKCGPVLQVPDMEMDAPCSAHWIPIGELPQRVRELGPFDAILVAELVEHLLTPMELLAMYEKANWQYRQVASEHVGEHVENFNRECPACTWVLTDVKEKLPAVIITTPDGSYRGPQQVNTHHVRAWSRGELEADLAPRGWLLEAGVVPHPGMGQANLVAVYQPGMDFRNKPPVTIWTGPHPFPWSPDSVDREGLGGSETAVVEVAKDISVHGYRALVYNEEQEGIWFGTRYRRWEKWEPGNPSWLFISWRHPEVFDNDIQANFKMLWMHDVDAGDALTPKRAAKIDVILALSEWHKKHLLERYPFLNDSQTTQVVIVGNGIDPTRFTWHNHEDHKRDRNKFLYTSSPDRGLMQLLDYWPAVREKLPEAELHIFYGWEYYDRMNPNGAFKAEVMAKVNGLRDAGVKWRGRVGQKDLAKEMEGATAWLYPGPHSFCETFCISVVEAQAAGAWPVTRDNGALPETNAGGTILPNDAPVAEWVSAIVEAASKPRGQRKRMAEKARKATWSKVTQEIMRVAFDLTKEATRKEAELEKAMAESAPKPEVVPQ